MVVSTSNLRIFAIFDTTHLDTPPRISKDTSSRTSNMAPTSSGVAPPASISGVGSKAAWVASVAGFYAASPGGNGGDMVFLPPF